MKVKGITRKIDNVGRICLPKEFRRSLKIEDEDNVEIILLEDGILIKKDNTDRVKNLEDYTKEELIEELNRRK